MYVATYVVTYIKITSYGSLDVHRAATITVCNPTYVHIQLYIIILKPNGCLL